MYTCIQFSFLRGCDSLHAERLRRWRLICRASARLDIFAETSAKISICFRYAKARYAHFVSEAVRPPWREASFNFSVIYAKLLYKECKLDYNNRSISFIAKQHTERMSLLSRGHFGKRMEADGKENDANEEGASEK